jgi:hypothetical protein
MEAIRRQAVVAAAVPMVRSPQDRTRMQTEVIPRRGRAVGAAGTEAMACLQAPAPEAAANPPTAGGRAVLPNDHGSPVAPPRQHQPISMTKTVENQPWYPKWRKAVQRLILAREALRNTKEGSSAHMEAELEYGAAWSAYKSIADQV